MANISRLRSEFGQSPWLDNVSRDLIENGHLQKLFDSGIAGVTSNPTIFEHSISVGDSYNQAIKQFASAGQSNEDIYWELVIADIKDAAQLLLPHYESSGHSDGFVSIEVSPKLYNDTIATVAQAKKLWSRLNMPNVMIKVPATPEGLPAIATLLSDGINVNVTLIFGLKRYLQVITAYMIGVEQCKTTPLPRSVASFFVSRVDTMIDPMLDVIGSPEALALRGKIGVAQAQAAYGLFLDAFTAESDRWGKLVEKGCATQRPLWASTSTKNPSYDDLLYVSNLVANDTVNTLPENTIEAINDHLPASLRKVDFVKIEEAHDILNTASKVGIDMHDISEKLEAEGVSKFIESYENLLLAIEKKR